MSRQSDAKKARRKKRKAVQDVSWIPEDVYTGLVAAEDDPIAEAVADIDEWLASRDWVLDEDSSERLVSWFYPPSAAECDDENCESVTRMWMTVAEDDDAVVLEFGAVLAGSGPDDDTYLLDPETLDDEIAALEAYRPGLPRPEFT